MHSMIRERIVVKIKQLLEAENVIKFFNDTVLKNT